MSLSTSLLRLAVDIGGTFTDTVLMKGDGCLLASRKTLTTHDNPTDGAMTGVETVLASAGVSPDQIGGFIHGTTLATNALIEKRGARVATVTTKGFRDILEIAYERRYSQYDISLEKPDLLVPRRRTFTIEERVNAAGDVLIPLKESEVTYLVERLDSSGADAVAICLLHAYANADHELRLRDLLQEARPNLTISLSHEVSPEAREFDRLCTTVANACIQNLMARYLADFATRFKEKGIGCPILMMTAGGGMTTLQTAARFPIRLVESGPAGGAILAARIAAETNLQNVLSFDMGGTTAKLCLIDKFRPQSARNFEIARAARFIKGSGMPVRIPVIEMIEIGAGGGSIASVDPLGRLTVGPKSAGSEPGPVAFQRGGDDPTVTDSDVVLGYIRPDLFADGAFTLDAEGAGTVIERDIAKTLGLEAVQAADGISRIVDENMASAGRMHAVESGKDLGPRTMIAFGGNGPLHASRVARAAGVSRILIPPDPSVGSAIGFLYAPVSFEIVRSRHAILADMDYAGVNSFLKTIEQTALDVVRQGAPNDPVIIERTAFMRYQGQGHEIEITLPEGTLQPHSEAGLRETFEKSYAAQFSRPVPGMTIEILNWAVRVSTERTDVSYVAAPSATHEIAASQTVRIWCDAFGDWVDAARIERADLKPGDFLKGPALVSEPQTTTLVSSDFSLSVDLRGNLILDRLAQQGDLS